ncbi:Zinc finger BED domain-containing protein RICESLEEPER 2 [Linum grandiflorum]
MSEFEHHCQHEEGDEEDVSEEMDWDPASQMGEFDEWELNNQDGIIRQGLAKMMVLDKLSFQFVEQEGYKKFMSIACPKFKIPSEEALMSECYELFLDEKVSMKRCLKDSCSGKVSLTVDQWRTGSGEVGYLCVTAHFVDDDWELNKRILSFIPISSTAKGVDIGNAIESCLLDWGIDEVFSITMDGGSSNDVAVGYIRDRLNQRGTSILGGKFLHIRCMSEIIKSVAFDLLKEMGMSVKRVREAIRYIIVSDSRLYKFKQCVAVAGSISISLPFDEPTNWKSTYLMLQSACKLETAFNQFASTDGGIRMPDATDWAKVTRLVGFLEQLHTLTLNISGSLYTSSDVFLADFHSVPEVLNRWMNGDDVELSEMAERMKEKYHTMWSKVQKNHKLLYTAAIFDPRYKLDYVEFALSKMYEDGEVKEELAKQVKQDVYQLFEYYDVMFGKRETDEPVETGRLSTIMASYFKYMREQHAKLGSELDRFLRASYVRERNQFDILEWWKSRGSKSYPILARMAKDILAVPVTTAAPEAAFCSDGRVLNSFLSSLTPKIAEALICSRDWLRSSADQVAAVGDSLDLSSMEAEYEQRV